MSWPFWAQGQRVAGAVLEPVPSGAFADREPAGLALYSDVEFDGTFDNSAVSSPTVHLYKGQSNGAAVTKFGMVQTSASKATTVPGEGESGQWVLQSRWENGTGAGSSIAPGFYGSQFSQPVVTPTRHAHIAWTFRLKAPWVHDEAAGTKIVYPLMFVDGNSLGKFVLNAMQDGSVTSTIYRWILSQNSYWNGSAVVSPTLHQNVNGTKRFTVGSWYKMQMEVKLETLGVTAQTADGIIRLWSSDWTGSGWAPPVLLMEYTNLIVGGFLATTSKHMGALLFDLYRGGNASPILPHDVDMQFSRVRWSGAP